MQIFEVREEEHKGLQHKKQQKIKSNMSSSVHSLNDVTLNF